MSTTKELCISVSLHVYNINCSVHVYKKKLDVWHRNLFVGMVKMYTSELIGQWLHDLSIIKRFLKKIDKLLYLYHNLICWQQQNCAYPWVYMSTIEIVAYMCTKKNKTCERVHIIIKHVHIISTVHMYIHFQNLTCTLGHSYT